MRVTIPFAKSKTLWGAAPVPARVTNPCAAGVFPLGGRALRPTAPPNSAEIKDVYGMGSTTGNDPLECNCNSPTTNDAGTSTGNDTNTFSAMTVANATTMLVNLRLSDRPTGYRPQKGLPAYTALTYNHREALQPATFSYLNVGQKWTLNWVKMVIDTPTDTYGVPITRADQGGGGYYFQAFSNGTYPEQWGGVQMSRTPTSGTATSYTRLFPDGSKEVYGLNNGATSGTRLWFITQAIDKAGNTTTYNYDGTFRLTSVVDAMGRSTTFTYGLSGYPLMVTEITDPFSRTAQLTYDTSQRLSSITDAVGITSTFTYGSSLEPDFVTQLTTPYGSSNYSDALPTADTTESNTRALLMTDPLGYSEFLYYYPNPSLISGTDPAALVPKVSGFSFYNAYLNYRNTFYWNKHAFAYPGAVTLNSDGSVHTEDVTKSLITHWVHDNYVTTNTGAVKESIKPPLENRIWFYYPLATYSLYDGQYHTPQYIGRVLDDGTTSQIQAATYNTTYSQTTVAGNKLTSTDPWGASTKYTYATNNIDLLTVQQ